MTGELNICGSETCFDVTPNARPPQDNKRRRVRGDQREPDGDPVEPGDTHGCDHSQNDRDNNDNDKRTPDRIADGRRSNEPSPKRILSEICPARGTHGHPPMEHSPTPWGVSFESDRTRSKHRGSPDPVSRPNAIVRSLSQPVTKRPLLRHVAEFGYTRRHSVRVAQRPRALHHHHEAWISVIITPFRPASRPFRTGDEFSSPWSGWVN